MTKELQCAMLPNGPDASICGRAARRVIVGTNEGCCDNCFDAVVGSGEMDDETANKMYPVLVGDVEAPVVSIDSARPPPPISAEQRKELQKQFWTDVLMQIVDTPRFLEFMGENYEIQKGVDEKTKTVFVRVLEKPPIEKAKGKLTPDMIFKMHIALMQSGAREPRKVLERLLKIMGEEVPALTLASEADLQREIDQSSLKEKLDP